jgi:hypothetical protein
VSFDYASMPSSSTIGNFLTELTRYVGVLRLDHDSEIDPCVENAGSHAHAHGLSRRPHRTDAAAQLAVMLVQLDFMSTDERQQF